MKQFKGRAIYNPSGKAGEYSYWACNFYTGCSHNCHYCYCKRGIMAHTWGILPTLKACFKNREHAIEVFEKELKANLPELQKHGLFFSFTTDPMLKGTIELTWDAICIAAKNNVKCKILTKRASWVKILLNGINAYRERRIEVDSIIDFIAFGFTLTGHDELEPNASTNTERIEAMKKLHDVGFKVWASIEPIIDFKSSKEMIRQTAPFTNLYKIGLESGKKYSPIEARAFMGSVNWFTRTQVNPPKVYFKDSLLSIAGVSREDLPSNCVSRDYNIFNES
ncbi:MAG: radical SAM protein [Bacteroidetes bacterium]|nr:radical SAM protein [Bacteroidota bacterium]